MLFLPFLPALLGDHVFALRTDEIGWVGRNTYAQEPLAGLQLRNAQEQLADANKLLAERTQGLADAKKRSEEVTIEESHALTDAQQDAAEFHRAVAALVAPSEGVKPTTPVHTSAEVQAVRAAQRESDKPATGADVSAALKAEHDGWLADAQNKLKASQEKLELDLAQFRLATANKLLLQKIQEVATNKNRLTETRKVLAEQADERRSTQQGAARSEKAGVEFTSQGSTFVPTFQDVKTVAALKAEHDGWLADAHNKLKASQEKLATSKKQLTETRQVLDEQADERRSTQQDAAGSEKAGVEFASQGSTFVLTSQEEKTVAALKAEHDEWLADAHNKLKASQEKLAANKKLLTETHKVLDEHADERRSTQQDAAGSEKVGAEFASKGTAFVPTFQEVKTVASLKAEHDEWLADAHNKLKASQEKLELDHAQFRLATANKLLLEKIQEVADATKRSEDLTIEEQRAGTEAQQDAAEAQKTLAELSKQVKGTTPTEPVRTSTEAKAVPAPESKAVLATAQEKRDKSEMEEGLKQARLALRDASAALEEQRARVVKATTQQQSPEKLQFEKQKLTKLQERATVHHKIVDTFTLAVKRREASTQSTGGDQGGQSAQEVKKKADALQDKAEESAMHWLAARRKTHKMKEAVRVTEGL